MERKPGADPRLGVVYGAGEGDKQHSLNRSCSCRLKEKITIRGKLTGLTELTGKLSPN